MKISREDEFILSVISPTKNEEVINKLHILLSSELDWDYIFIRSASEGVVPLVYYNTEKYLDFIIPVSTFKNYYHKTLIECEAKHQELEKILESLTNKKIKFMPSKGVVLSNIVYPSPGVRPFADMDFLIQKSDLNKIKEELHRLGYELISPLEEEIDIKCGYGLNFLKKGKIPFCVELHWDIRVYELKKLIRIDIEKMWENAKLVKIRNTEVFIQSPEDLFLHLCFHLGFGHSFKRFLWFCDIAYVIEYYKEIIEWDKIISLSRNTNLQKCIYYSLKLCKDIFQTSVPYQVLRKLDFKDLKCGEIFLKETFLRKDIRRVKMPYYLFVLIYRFWKNQLREYIITTLLLDDFKSIIRLIFYWLFSPVGRLPLVYNFPPKYAIYFYPCHLILTGMLIFLSILRMIGTIGYNYIYEIYKGGENERKK
jgi:hypothetical protein